MKNITKTTNRKAMLMIAFVVALFMASTPVMAQDYVYQKVTSTPSDWTGTYILAYGTQAFNGSILSNKGGVCDIATSSGEIVSGVENCGLVYVSKAATASGTDYYVIACYYNNAWRYLTYSSGSLSYTAATHTNSGSGNESKEHTPVTPDQVCQWKIENNSGKITFSNRNTSSSHIMYNNYTSGSEYFGLANSGTTTTHLELALYKQYTNNGCTDESYNQLSASNPGGTATHLARAPYCIAQPYSYKQIVYPASSDIPEAITSIGFMYYNAVQNVSITGKNNVTIYLGDTDVSNLDGGWVDTRNMTKVYEGPMNFTYPTGKKWEFTDFIFNRSGNVFLHNTSKNLVVAILDASNAANDHSSKGFFYKTTSGNVTRNTYSSSTLIEVRDGDGMPYLTTTPADGSYITGTAYAYCPIAHFCGQTIYTVTIDDGITNGTVTADLTTVPEGATVTLTVTPDDGYETSSVTVTTTAKTSYDVTDNGDGTYSFTMPAEDVTVSAEFSPTTVYYRKVTGDRTDWSGTYLLAGQNLASPNPATTWVYNGANVGAANISNTVAAVNTPVSDGFIINPDGVVEVTIEYVTTDKNVRYYCIGFVYNEDTYYWGNNTTSSQSPLLTSMEKPNASQNKYLWSIEAVKDLDFLSGYGNIRIKNKYSIDNSGGAWIMFRYTYDPAYRTFTTSTSYSGSYNAAGYSMPKLYEKVYKVEINGLITNGTIEVDKEFAAEGETVTIKTHPSIGYATTEVTTSPAQTISGDVDTGYTFTFVMPANDVVVSANFGAGSGSVYHSITCLPSSAVPVNGYITTGSLVSAAPGTIVSITAMPDDGYKLSSIKVTDGDDNSYPVNGIGRTFFMPAVDVTVTAGFCPFSSIAMEHQIGEQPASCGSAGGNFASINIDNANAYSEIIYLGEDLGGQETYITAISWYFNKSKAVSNSHYMRMYMKEISESSYTQTSSSGGYNYTISNMEGYTLVYEENISNWGAEGTGWYKFELPYPFKIDAANKNLAVAVFVQGSAESGKIYWPNNNTRTRCHRYKNGTYYYQMEVGETVNSTYINNYYPATRIEENSCITFPQITINPSYTHGDVTTTPEYEAMEGTTVLVNAVPENGYGVKSVSVVIDEDNTPVTVTNKEFIMPDKDVTVSVSFAETETECNNFEEYSSVASSQDFKDASGVLPEGWSYIYTGASDQAGSKPHLNKGKFSKGGVGVIMTAGGNSGSTNYGNNNYLITPFVLHQYDTVSFNSYFEGNNGILYYGYMTDPENASTFVSLGTANRIVYTSVTDPATDGFTKFGANHASEGYKLAFKFNYTSGHVSVVIDNLCIEAVPDTPSGGDTWVDAVTTKPEGYSESGSTITISSEEGLAWLITTVSNSADGLSGKTVNLTADLDMDDHIWVPIGYSSSKPFAGTFNGNNHTISNLHITSAEITDVETAAEDEMQYTGLFGYTNGAIIKNVVLTNGNELANNNASGSIGSIVGYANNSTIEFCQSEATLTAAGNITAMGGMVGTAAGTTNVNGVTSLVSMAHETNDVTSIGGVVGTGGTVKTYIANNTISGTGTVTNKSAVANSATVSNGYVLSTNSGYAVASGTGYAPDDYTTVTPYTYGSNSNTISNVPMVNLLNDGTPATNMAWKQAKGTRINGGYPIIVRTDDAVPMGCVKNGNLVRHDNVNTLLTGSASTDTVFMYGSGAITLSSAPAGKLYVDEDAALTQDNAFDLTATVGVTIDNTACNGEESRDWHVFSSALAAASIGISYGGSQVHAYGANDLPLGGATGFSLTQGNAAVYFPDGITTPTCDGTEFDLYAYSEPNYHWVNLKRETDNHYYEDTHAQFNYTNETTYTPGHGYFLSIGDNSTAKYTLLQATGTLNNGDVGPISVTNNGAHLPGYNLLGNPYQSYLDFDAFATANASGLWGTVASDDSVGYKAYLIYDADRDGFDEYLVDPHGKSFSQGALQTASQYIHPHQGFFVVMKDNGSGSVTFTDAMRVTNTSTAYRDEKPSYPLINLVCTDSEGRQDISVVEFERPSVAGSLKMKGMLNSKGDLYIRYNNEDFGSMFLSEVPEILPLWFRALEDGVFTLSWSTANGEFNNMHLIDNLTGADIDCNAAQSYTFESKQTDSKARFRLVFTPYGIDEQETVEGESFAFISNGELIVTGNGELSLIDLNGRILATEHISGEQSRISLPAVAEGMYLLRLTSNKGVRMQKIVVRR